ncbi:MAG: hypothetical protein ISS36_02725 [Candidatus Aenigmarchaeota archaeon]|nr:hypothetical protein [Candidatus Aenigmarchaeota archaeon]
MILSILKILRDGSMKEKYTCIICSEPVGRSGYIGEIKNIKVSFCVKHANDCEKSCETCMQTNKCPVFRMGG